MMECPPGPVHGHGRKELRLATDRWGLTEREAEVLALLAEGEANKSIARRLGAAPRTIEGHVASILRKAKADSRVRLVALFWTRR
jgi:DNA-binding CsgD family transcriptional regulator